MSKGSNVVCVESIELGEKLENILCFMKELTGSIDDVAIKENVSKFLKSVIEPNRFVVIGEVNAGKSSFINALIGDEVCQVAPIPCTNKIHEIRYGDGNVELDLGNFQRRQFVNSELLKNLSIVDTPGIGVLAPEQRALVENTIPHCDAVFVILPTDNAVDSVVWDFAEAVQEKWDRKMVFIVQQMDLISNEHLEQLLLSVKTKANTIGIEDPCIFPVSAVFEFESGKSENSGFIELRDFLKESITGPNAIMLKQQTVMNTSKEFFGQIASSFAKRKLQNAIDNDIVIRINGVLDDFHAEHKENIEMLIRELMLDINFEIDGYKNEIIKRLDPNTITERFKSKADFEKWLTIHNEYYKEKFINAVERRTQQAIKNYLRKMEDTIEAAAAIIGERQQLLAFEDSVYGTLARTQSSVISKTNLSLREIAVSNKTLYEASEELFIEIWSARKKSDFRKNATNFGVGGAIGIAVAAIILSPVVSGAITAAGVYGALSGVIAYFASNKIASDIYETKMHHEVDEAIRKFNLSIETIKLDVNREVTRLVTEVFDGELSAMERNFSEFRISSAEEVGKVRSIEVLLDRINDNMMVLEEYKSGCVR